MHNLPIYVELENSLFSLCYYHWSMSERRYNLLWPAMDKNDIRGNWILSFLSFFVFHVVLSSRDWMSLKITLIMYPTRYTIGGKMSEAVFENLTIELKKTSQFFSYT